ncbi:MAG TPA: hypothetical protein DDE71_04835, partial [Tenacibaculum sp.]|nr:hypothetical protein [Tenacibaculum sp.]
ENTGAPILNKVIYRDTYLPIRERVTYRIPTYTNNKRLLVQICENRRGKVVTYRCMRSGSVRIRNSGIVLAELNNF